MFIEGIESRVATGVKYEEISYQLAYSKQEIRKVIHEYPVKEVGRSVVASILLIYLPIKCLHLCSCIPIKH